MYKKPTRVFLDIQFSRVVPILMFIHINSISECFASNGVIEYLHPTHLHSYGMMLPIVKHQGETTYNMFITKYISGKTPIEDRE